ncbi:MAG TPA: SUMF1/EgtB/PvdO family nonheme iron enzyme [Thermoanaerobaculia bacterium]|nr:SUMF1/EgtB/PvdO family nonheme iron enzyme [Thermoanaerobaculia bacterium]
MAAAPGDLDPLDGAGEWRRLRRALFWLRLVRRVVLEPLRPATLVSLGRRLAASPPCQVLHVASHGDFDRVRDDGLLLLETAEGRADPVDSAALGALLTGRESLRLIVLNACEGARGSLDDPLAGLSRALVQLGIPAVLAMRRKISDEAALVFTQSFYERLATGAPIEAAVACARHALVDEGFTAEWGTPVLFLRAEDGRIVQPSPGWLWRLPAALLACGALTLGLLAFWNREQRSDAEFKEPTTWPEIMATDPRCPSPPDLELSFAYRAPGRFEMGGRDAKPIHQVEISKAFCISRYELTQKQWDLVMGDGTAQSTARTDRLPARGISWQDADRFVRKLRERYPDAGFRLPTEAEWESAARAESIGRFSFGDDIGLLPEHGNCVGRDDGYARPAPVGLFKPNQAGLYDVHGNVSEWVQDWFSDYPKESVRDPKGPRQGRRKVRRGGSWKIKAENCGVAVRTQGVLTQQRADVGLRLVRDPVPPRL